MKAYIKIFLATSIYWTVSMFIYLVLSDPIFHYKYTMLIRTLVLTGFGIIFGIGSMLGFWLLKKKNPNLSGLSNARQKRVVIFHGSLDEALTLCKQAFGSLKILETKNSNTMILTGNTPLTWLQFGENVEVRFVSLNNDVTEIHIASKPRSNIFLFDFGIGLYNVTVIEEALLNGAPTKGL